ncbi:MAG: hypothetical protein QOD61_1642, partial [Solirubrobacteraceae bacterium]|nr:hypothetical protein [Solirubrobacteraceae bacterium]
MGGRVRQAKGRGTSSRDRDRGRPCRRPALLLILAVVLLGLWAVPAAEAATGQITGTVTSASTGTPVSGATVELFDAAGNPVAFATTAPDGTYAFTGLATASYEVGFSSGASGANVLPEFYNHKPTLATADPVPVTDGNTTPGIDAALAPGGQITGTVRDAAGAPIPGASVTLYDRDRGFVTNTTAAGDGTYSLTGLATGTYYVGFVDTTGAHVARYYNGRVDQAAADPVTVTAPQTTPGIDGALPTGGQITGTVTDTAGTPLQGVVVNLYGSNGRPLAFSTTTAADGTYALTGLETGTYEVEFVDARDTGTPLVGQFYNGKPTIETADPVSVTVGATTPNINAQLGPGGNIAGTVSDTSGSPLAGVEADLYGQNGNFIASTTTDAAGTYSFLDLAPGSYKVGFVSGASGPNLAPQFFNGKSTLAAADPVPVNPGATTSGIDARLGPGGSISGRVTDPTSGSGLPGITVLLYDAAGDFVAGTTTNSDAFYSFSSLPGGTYFVGFSDPNGTRLARFYNGKPSLEAADPVVVAPGQPTSGINQTLPLAGLITGTVTDSAATPAPVGNVEVVVYDVNGQAVAIAFTASDGTYTVGGLETGTYRVGFTPSSGLAVQFYNAKPTLATADPVGVTSGTTTSGIDA